MRWFSRPSKEPLWQEEFSVYAADERYVNRRQFAKFLTLTSFGMFVGSLWVLVRAWMQGEPGYPTRTVARIGEIPVGGVKLFNYPGDRDACILVRLSETRFVAYSQKCTHLSCAVYYSSERSRLECPCHEGYFSVSDGRVLQGPPPRPLPRVVLEQRGDELAAVRLDLQTETEDGARETSS